MPRPRKGNGTAARPDGHPSRAADSRIHADPAAVAWLPLRRRAIVDDERFHRFRIRCNMWVKYLHNPKAVTGVFGESVPDLEELHFGQLLLNEGGQVSLSLDFVQLPENIPPRWREKGYDRVQLRLRFFGCNSLSVREAEHVIDPTVKFKLDLQTERAELLSHDSAFEMTVIFRQVDADFHPYRSKDRVDGYHHWYRGG
jgi:hypothetical protein